MGNQSSSIEQTWFHVVRVRSNSPAFKASIEPFFDFITCAKPEAADGEELADKPLQDIVQEHKDRRVNITIWSSKRQTFRGWFAVLFRGFPGSLKLNRRIDSPFNRME